jgi:hypothetical protein
MPKQYQFKIYPNFDTGLFQSLIGISFNYNFICDRNIIFVRAFQSLIGISFNCNTIAAVTGLADNVSIPDRD